MNPRQRRGILLIGLAVVAAIVVFFAVASYVRQIQSQVGPMVRVLQLDEAVAPYDPIAEDAVRTVELPERWAPAAAFSDPVDVVGNISPVELPAGTVLQTGMVIAAPQLEPGQRELAIMVDAETGVAGKIRPGDQVDIYATFPGTDVAPPWASIVVDRARIIDIGVPQANQRTAPDGQFREGEIVPVTFALSVADSLRVAHVESFAASVRLALREPTDDASLDEDQRRYQPFPPEEGESL